MYLSSWYLNNAMILIKIIIIDNYQDNYFGFNYLAKAFTLYIYR
jgi:hypothetical protein